MSLTKGYVRVAARRGQPCNINDCGIATAGAHPYYCGREGKRHFTAVRKYGVLQARWLDRIGSWTGEAMAYVRDLRGEPTWMYRWYRHDGTLLYTGITADHERAGRTIAHSRTSAWWPIHDPSRTRWDWFPNRLQAKRAETETIRDERPLYNISESLLPAVGRYMRTLPPHVAARVVLL